MINFELPSAIYHNRFYRCHSVEVSNTIRLALVILGTAALSTTCGWPYVVSADMVFYCQIAAGVSAFVATFFRFEKPYTVILENEEDYQNLIIEKIERLEIIGIENYDRIKDQLQNAKKMWFLALTYFSKEELEGIIPTLPKVKQLWINKELLQNP